MELLQGVIKKMNYERFLITNHGVYLNKIYFDKNTNNCKTNVIKYLEPQLKICEMKIGKFKITSGVRSTIINKNVGGAENSLHLYGLAIDGYFVQYPTPKKESIKFIAKWIEANTLFSEILYYPKKYQWHLGIKTYKYINLEQK